MTKTVYDLRSAFPLRDDASATADEKDKDEAKEEKADEPVTETTNEPDEAAGEEGEEAQEGQPEDEHAQALQAAQDRADRAEAELRALRVRTAFLAANAGRPEPFKDPDVAYGLVTEREGIDVEDDGTVVGLEAAMDAVATKYPYLVDDSKVVEPESAKAKINGIPDLGRGFGGRRRPTNGLTREALAKKYPALRTRG